MLRYSILSLVIKLIARKSKNKVQSKLNTYRGNFAAVGVYKTENFAEALCLSRIGLLRWLEIRGKNKVQCTVNACRYFCGCGRL